MKLKVTVSSSNKTISGTKDLPAKDHLAAQLKYPKIIQKDKTIYSRKTKHKNKKEMDNENE
jgi:hypothetical protein